MVDIWDEEESTDEYLTDEQVKELKQLLKSGWNSGKGQNKYLDKLAEFWIADGNPEYAEECMMQKKNNAKD